MKLSDPTQGLRNTSLEQVSLQNESLAGLSQFWDESAQVDAIKAIADQEDSESFESSGRAEAEELLALVGPNPVVLEIGSGIGRIMGHLAGSSAEVHGVDISQEMVEVGTRRLQHLPNVQFHKGNGYDLAMFEDSRFDLVYSTIVFQHIPKTVAYNYLTEVRRVLKADGRFRLHVPNLLLPEQFNAFHHFTQPYFVEHPYPMNFYTPPEISMMLRAAGLSVDSMTEDMVVLARMAIPGAEPSVEWLRALPEARDLFKRIADLESKIDWMNRVYDHPLVKAARAVRRQLLRMRAGS